MTWTIVDVLIVGGISSVVFVIGDQVRQLYNQIEDRKEMHRRTERQIVREAERNNPE